MRATLVLHFATLHFATLVVNSAVPASSETSDIYDDRVLHCARLIAMGEWCWAETAPKLAERWGVSVITVRNYRRAALCGLRQDGYGQELDEIRHQVLVNLSRVARAAETRRREIAVGLEVREVSDPDYATAVRAYKEIAAIFGLSRFVSRQPEDIERRDELEAEGLSPLDAIRAIARECGLDARAITSALSGNGHAGDMH